MASLGLERSVIDPAVRARTVERFQQAGIKLPTFAQLAKPSSIDVDLSGVDPDAPDPRNLFRVHWYNDASRHGRVEVPGHIELPSELTGVDARIVVALGRRFPMIGAHKVLAAYGCLVPRLVTGQFDPANHKAVWPSTGNYCRGGVAISRILGCRGVAVLPEGMSRERFEWLERWSTDPAVDIIRTYGTESNVKEIYDECARLDAEPNTIIFNQFCEFANHLVHYSVTGPAMAQIAAHVGGNARAFVSATGSAGTIAAGDYLKEHLGALTVAVEALECPTLLYNGFGEHNIQGIGDKHVPFIHNVMATDAVAGISDLCSDTLFLLFQSEAGRDYLVNRRGVPAETVAALDAFGFSGIANVLAAIKTARYYRLGSDDVVLTVATDSGRMYGSEVPRAIDRWFGGRYDAIGAAETYGQAILGAGVDHVRELTRVERDRIFNLGYYTWVEQQGVSLEDFEARRDPSFWRNLRQRLPAWDERIVDFNRAAGASVTA